jgi:hypothetical protein
MADHTMPPTMTATTMTAAHAQASQGSIIATSFCDARHTLAVCAI